MKRRLQKYAKYLFIFFFFLIISMLMPISGDDWNNYLVGSKGIHHMIGQAIGMYFDWEGRFVSRLLINFLTYNKWLFNLFLAVLMTMVIYFIEHLSYVRNRKVFFVLLCLSFLLLNNSIFTQTILWVAGSITYMFPTVLIVGYIYIYFRYLENNCYSKIIYIILGLFSFMIPMFVENIAFSFVLLNLVLFIYEYIRYKRFNKLLLSNLIISFVGAFLMFVSPGSQARSNLENVEFAKSSIFAKVIYNYSNFIYYTISSNIYLIVLMTLSAISISIMVYKRLLFRVLSIIFVTVYPLVHILIYSFGIYKIGILDSIYWLLYLCYIVFITIYYVRGDNDKLKLYMTLIISGLSSNLVMMITPAYSGRTTLFCVVLLSTLYLYVLDDLLLDKIKEWVYRLITFATISISVVFVVAYINLYRFNLFLEESIASELESNSSSITIYESPLYLSWGLMPTGEYHTRTFKEYYNIPQDRELVYGKSVWSYYIFFDYNSTIKKGT